METLPCRFCGVPVSHHADTDPRCESCGRKLSSAVERAVDAPAPGPHAAGREGSITNGLGIAPLVGGPVPCACRLALMFVRQSAQGIFQPSYWLGEYLWIVAPYGALAMATALAWRS